jgi:hypothetical protein
MTFTKLKAALRKAVANQSELWPFPGRVTAED